MVALGRFELPTFGLGNTGLLRSSPSEAAQQLARQGAVTGSGTNQLIRWLSGNVIGNGLRPEPMCFRPTSKRATYVPDTIRCQRTASLTFETASLHSTQVHCSIVTDLHLQAAMNSLRSWKGYRIESGYPFRPNRNYEKGTR